MIRWLSILLMSVSLARAATNSAVSVSRTDVQNAVNAASSGDTVLVPAGTATWSTAVTVTGKALNLIGNGIGSTVITDGTTTGALLVTASVANFVRVSGFEFHSSGTHTSEGIVEFTGPQAELAFRFDHNRILITSAVTRGVTVESVYGLIDHLTGDWTGGSGSVQMISIWGSPDGTDGGFTPWTRPLTLGTANAVYIEDSTITYASNDESLLDAYGGARLVFRYNSINGGEACGGHGTDSGGRRSIHSFEVYHNTYVNNTVGHIRGGTVRGGTGVIYSNTYGGTGPWDDITLMYYRACPPLDQSDWGTCDGTLWKLGSTDLSNSGSRTCSTTGTVGFNTTDKETLGTWGGSYQRYFDGPGANGYPGRDQPGVTTGQVVEPIYVWSNGLNAGTYDGGYPPPGGIEAWVQSGRDYINNGSTPKPGYTAYTYPHPLQNTPSPGSPLTFHVNNLRIP